MDDETYIYLLAVRNIYSHQARKNVSIAWIIKNMVIERHEKLTNMQKSPTLFGHFLDIHLGESK